MMEVSVEDILKISSGTDSEGNPLAAGMLALDKFTEEGQEPETLDNVLLENAVFDVIAEGGCAVVKLIFSPASTVFCEKAERMCTEWVARDASGRQTESLSLLLSPYLLNGCIYILFRDPVFAYTHVTSDGGRCLILAFDHSLTIPYETEDTDYNAIVREVEAELKRREEELCEELDDAKKEEEEARAAGSYDFGRAIAERYSPDNPDTRNEPVEKEKIRSGKCYRGIRIAKEDGDHV